MKVMLTIEALRAVLHYDADSGVFTWRFASKGTKAGAVAGTIVKGYVRIRIAGKCYAAHRLAFLYSVGRWPVGDIDHRDRDRSNNRWSNLREATRAQNLANMRAKSNHLKGAFFDRPRDKFTSRIRHDGKNLFLGRFDTEIEAHLAYISAAARLKGEFARFT